MGSIYGLYDDAGRLRYIGKANNPAKRLASHMRDARRRSTPLYNWIAKHGRPEMRVLEADCEDWREAEIRLIREARQRGEHLLNLAAGGEQPHCSLETRKANGRALVAHLAENPEANRLRDMKRSLVTAMKAGYVRNATRAILRETARLCPQKFACFEGIPDRIEDANGRATVRAGRFYVTA